MGGKHRQGYYLDYYKNPENYQKWYEIHLRWKQNNLPRRRYNALKNWYKTRGKLKIFYKKHGKMPLTPLQIYRKHLKEQRLKIGRKILPKRIPKIQDRALRRAIIQFRSKLAGSLR